MLSTKSWKEPECACQPNVTIVRETRIDMKSLIRFVAKALRLNTPHLLQYVSEPWFSALSCHSRFSWILSPAVATIDCVTPSICPASAGNRYRNYILCRCTLFFRETILYSVHFFRSGQQTASLV